MIEPNHTQTVVTEHQNVTLNCSVDGTDLVFEWKQLGDKDTILETSMYTYKEMVHSNKHLCRVSVVVVEVAVGVNVDVHVDNTFVVVVVFFSNSFYLDSFDYQSSQA